METLQTIEQALAEKRARLKLVNSQLGEARTAVSNARSTLNANDYKRHKNVEYGEMGLDLPYSWNEIHSESQALRDIINENEPKCESLSEERIGLAKEIRELLKLRAEKRATQNEEPALKEESTTEKGTVWAFETTGN